MYLQGVGKKKRVKLVVITAWLKNIVLKKGEHLWVPKIQTPVPIYLKDSKFYFLKTVYFAYQLHPVPLKFKTHKLDLS